MKWYFYCIRHYAKFSGRATRKEYWMFMLFDVIIMFVVALLCLLLGSKPSAEEYVSAAQYSGNVSSLVMCVYLLLTLLPRMAVTARRLHDTDRSGWYMIIPVVVGFVGNLLMMASRSETVGIIFGIAQLAASIYLISLLCQRSDPDENDWGESPYPEDKIEE